MQSRLRLTRQQILAFRRRVGGLDERMPTGRSRCGGRRGRACRTACREPRCSRCTRASTGSSRRRGRIPRSPSCGGRATAPTSSPKRDFALFSLGRLPDSAKGRLRAERMAERLHADLDGARMTDREVGRAIGVGNAIRYAATTGTVAIRWEGARAPIVWTVAARRHRSGRRVPRARPALPARLRADDGRRVRPLGGDLAARGGRRVRLARRIAAAGPIAARRRVAARRRRAGACAPAETRRRARAPAAERRRLLPARRSRAGAARPAGGSAGAALDVARVAGRAPRRRRDPRNLETGAAHRADRRVGAPARVRARRGRGRGRRPAASRPRPADRGGLGRMSAAAMQPVSNLGSTAMATREAVCHCGQLRLEVAGDPLVVSI